jgi:hypothetical protein
MKQLYLKVLHEEPIDKLTLSEIRGGLSCICNGSSFNCSCYTGAKTYQCTCNDTSGFSCQDNDTPGTNPVE